MSEYIPLDTKTGKVLETSSSAGLVSKPIDFSDVTVIGISGSGGGGFLDSGATPLVNGQSYVDVVFHTTQADANWILTQSSVNTVDATPLNIWPGMVSSKTTTGCRVQLNGVPDSGNYYLNWGITAGLVAPPATTDTRITSGGDTRITSSGDTRIVTI